VHYSLYFLFFFFFFFFFKRYFDHRRVPKHANKTYLLYMRCLATSGGINKAVTLLNSSSKNSTKKLPVDNSNIDTVDSPVHVTADTEINKASKKETGSIEDIIIAPMKDRSVSHPAYRV
jgi:hypothetical protein